MLLRFHICQKTNGAKVNITKTVQKKIYLKDISKPQIKERLSGIPTVACTGPTYTSAFAIFFMNIWNFEN